MDPNETLRAIRALLTEDDGRTDPELADKVRALDEWLTKGGFLPEAWDHAPYAKLRANARQSDVEHGLDWKDLGQAYQGTCECGEWSNTGDTLVELLGRYELHLRGAGVPAP